MTFAARLVLVLLFTVSLLGQAARPLKVAVIDTEKILLSSATGKAALADLKKLQEQRGNELLARQQAIRSLQAKINDQRMTLSQEKLAAMEKELEGLTIGLQRLQDDTSRELDKKREDILAAIDVKVMPIINRFGKEQGYSFIFRKFESGLIFADEAFDVTDAIIKRLDASGK